MKLRQNCRKSAFAKKFHGSFLARSVSVFNIHAHWSQKKPQKVRSKSRICDSFVDEIWILVDDRSGTASQAIGLAEEIGLKSKTIKLDYSALSTLPNFFLSESLRRLSAKSRAEFQNLDHLPKLIISAGRRSAPIALYLKKLSQNQSKIIQIMNPNLDFKKFDFVILPKHDSAKEPQFPNLITTIGSLTKTNDTLIKNECEKFAPDFANITKQKIALMVGGSSKKTKFTSESAEKLAKISSEIANKMNATLLVLTSRRTGDELTNTLKSNLSCDFRFFDWSHTMERNPYLAILGYADFFVITGDSVSMISECCSTGKPVYIFDDKEISTKKHRLFHQNLLSENYAKKLLKTTDPLEIFPTQKLRETERVSKIILSKF